MVWDVIVSLVLDRPSVRCLYSEKREEVLNHQSLNL